LLCAYLLPWIRVYQEVAVFFCHHVNIYIYILLFHPKFLTIYTRVLIQCGFPCCCVHFKFKIWYLSHQPWIISDSPLLRNCLTVYTRVLIYCGFLCCGSILNVKFVMYYTNHKCTLFLFLVSNMERIKTVELHNVETLLINVIAKIWHGDTHQC
jgi:hypothetical protein